jgi:hypothetical protein
MTDVIARLGQLAGADTVGQRFCVPTRNNRAMIGAMAKSAALTKEGINWGGAIKGVAKGVAKGGKSLFTTRGGRAALGAGLGAGAGAAWQHQLGDENTNYWQPMLAGAAGGAAIGGGGGDLAKGLFTRPGAAGRVVAPGRIAATAGALGAAGLWGVPHLQQSAEQTVGTRMFNPFTWGGQRRSEGEVFRSAMQNQQAQMTPMIEELNKAYDAGDADKIDKLNAQMESGDVGGGWRMGGLNPWFAGQSARDYRNVAGGVQTKMQERYNKAMRVSAPTAQDLTRMDAIDRQLASGTLLPGHRDVLARQRAILQQKLKNQPGFESPAAIKARQEMEALQPEGMHFRPYTTYNANQPAAGGHYFGPHSQGLNYGAGPAAASWRRVAETGGAGAPQWQGLYG